MPSRSATASSSVRQRRSVRPSIERMPPWIRGLLEFDTSYYSFVSWLRSCRVVSLDDRETVEHLSLRLTVISIFRRNQERPLVFRVLPIGRWWRWRPVIGLRKTWRLGRPSPLGNVADTLRQSLSHLLDFGGGGGGDGLDSPGGFGVLPPVLGGGFGMGLGFVSMVISLWMWDCFLL